MSYNFAESKPHAILVVLPTWVGDFVMATPTLRAIRQRFAEAQITFLAEPNLRELIYGGDWMDDCIEWPAKKQRSPWNRAYHQLIQELRRRRFDHAILLPNKFRSALTVWLGGAKRRTGYDRDARGWLLNDRLPVKNRLKGKFDPMPLVEYYADLAESIGCERPNHQLELFTTPDCEQSVDDRLHKLGVANNRPLIVLTPGAKFGAAKCWPTERFAEVADRWVEEHHAVVAVTCGPGEQPIAQAIAKQARNKLLVFTGKEANKPCATLEQWSDQSPERSDGVEQNRNYETVTALDLLTLGELKSLIRRCDLLICNDTGPRHIAKAFGIPVVTIFGPTHPEWTATDYPDERIVRIDVDCGPCQKPVCPLGHLKCMTGVSADAVYQAGQQLLQNRQQTT